MKKIIHSIFKTFILSSLIIAQVHFAFAQTASILPNAKTSFYDLNGNPVTSGTVEFFVPGQTTHKTTWQDSAETIPNENPLHLDAAGRAIIWGDGAYRQVVKDSNHNLIWDAVTASPGGGSRGGAGTVGDSNSVGAIVPWSGLTLPSGYLYAAGQAVVRTTYPLLLSLLTQTSTVTCTGGNPTLTSLTNTEQLNIGAVVEALCVTGPATIIFKTATSVTLSANATLSISTSAIFYPYGNGDGLTTFNLPDYRGVVLPGRNNMNGVASSNLTSPLYTDPNALNGIGGSQSTTLGTPNLPPYTPAGSIANGAITVNGDGAVKQLSTAVAGASNFAVPTYGAASPSASQATSTFTGTAQGGTSAPFRTIQPSKTINYIIKVLPNPTVTTAVCGQLQDAGTACQADTGTSGRTVPFLDGSNLFSGDNTFSGTNTFTNGFVINGTPAALVGRPSSSTGADTDFTIQGLTARGAPDPANDKMLIYDNAAGSLKYVTPALIASAATAGVSSLGGQTGALTCGAGIICAGGSIAAAASVAQCQTLEAHGGGVAATGAANLTAFNAVVSSLSAGNGGCIALGAGTYSFASNTTVNLPNKSFNLNIFGTGQASTAVSWSNAGGGFTFNYTNPANSVNVYDMSIVTTVPTGGGIAINLTQTAGGGGPAYSSFTRLIVGGGSGFWNTGLTTGGVTSVNVIGDTFYGTTGTVGVQCNGTSDSTYSVIMNVNTSTFWNHTAAIAMSNFCQSLFVTQFNIVGGETGILLNGTQGVQSNLNISNGEISLQSGSAIAINGQLIDFQVSGMFLAVVANQSAISTASTGFGNIYGNDIGCAPGHTGTGIGMQGNSSNMMITGNNIRDCGIGVVLAAGTAAMNVQSNLYPGTTIPVLNNGTGNTVGGGSP